MKIDQYYNILLSIGGGDLAGEYEDMLNKANQYDSFEEFIKEDLEILQQDNPNQVEQIKKLLI